MNAKDAPETETHLCRTCGRRRMLTPIGENPVGRTVWRCPDGHTQAGPEPRDGAVLPNA